MIAYVELLFQNICTSKTTFVDLSYRTFNKCRSIAERTVFPTHYGIRAVTFQELLESFSSENQNLNNE